MFHDRHAVDQNSLFSKSLLQTTAKQLICIDGAIFSTHEIRRKCESSDAIYGANCIWFDVTAKEIPVNNVDKSREVAVKQYIKEQRKQEQSD